MPEHWRLRPAEKRVLAALADTVIPRGGAFPIGAQDVEFEQPFEQYLRGLDRLYARLYRGHLRLFNYGPLIHFYKPRRFTELSPEERAEYCRRLEGSKRFGSRMFLFLLKFLISFIVYSDPRIEAEVGFRRHCDGDAQGV